MLKNLKIGTKLMTVLVAPVVVLIVLAAVGISTRLDDQSNAERVEELTQFAAVNSELINQLENEMILSAAYMAANKPDRTGRYEAELAEQRTKTDAALDAYTAALASTDPGADDEAIADAVKKADDRLRSLPTTRTSVDLVQSVPAIAVDNFTNLTGNLISVNASLVQEATDAQLLLGLNTVANFENVKDIRASEYALVAAAAVKGAFINDEGLPCASVTDDCSSYAATTQAVSDEAQASETFDEFASAADKTAKRDAEAGLAVDDLVTEVIEEGQDNNVITVSPDEVILASVDANQALFVVEQSFIDNVVTRANDLAAEARQSAALFAVGTVVAIALAILIAYLVARATTVPLRKLTSAAYTLSTERLPGLVERLRNPDENQAPLSATLTPIDIDSKDEVGQLADAFNSIQQVTVEVAEEQAQLLRKGIGDIFINLARRNQTLLDRQIEFIDQLEANEEDPDQLDNLFKLDHLATRMRRNAESLLVLAGAEPPRRRGRPVDLADVVRVAIGEVEDFARIQLLALDEATVGGNVAVDLAHLLSELMENATHFSPPDTMVEIVGHRAGAEGYIISVSDQGIGMSADQLADANVQLARPPLVGLALSRSLGFIVIGRLAQRFGISVKLTASPAGGVTALVTLPPDLVTYPGEEYVDEPIDTPAAPAAEAELAPSDEVEVEAVEIEVAETIEVVEEPEPEAEPVEADEPVVVAEVEVVEEEIEIVDEPAEVADSSDDLLDELLEEVVPEGDEFDRGLQSLVDEELAPGPVEPAAPSASALDDDESVPGAFGSVATAEVEEAPAAEAVSAPAPEAAPEPVAEVAKPLTAAGLVKRTPKKRSEKSVGTEMPTVAGARTTGQTQRSPEEVRKMLSRYRSGLNKGRGGADSDSRTDA